ncbi:MAG TPA: hypothetical protein VL354_17870 [Spirochaetia bacterium]|nr:hypothetical protein [Spirochaetia bacterium]
MWYTVLLTLVIDFGGLLLVYVLLRDRVRRATSAATQIAELRDEVSRLVVELNQTTERNVALLEDRVTQLNELLSTADRKMGLLQREMEKHDVGAKVYSRLVEKGDREAPARDLPVREPPVPTKPPTPLSVELSEKVSTGAGATPAAGAVETGVRRHDTHQRVILLSQSGFSAPLIAAQVGIPLGEVELIISLERQRMSQPQTTPGKGLA